MADSRTRFLSPTIVRKSSSGRVWTSVVYALIVLHCVFSVSTTADGYLIQNQNDQINSNEVAKRGKRGVAVNIVNVFTDEEQDSNDSNNQFPVLIDNAQCNATGEKLDCAFFGVTRNQCLTRGCCYSEVRDGPAPWCYLPKTSLVTECQGREDSRLQCGYYNIGRDECQALGCCWRPTSSPGVPWCYNNDGSSGSSDHQSDINLPKCGTTPIEPNVNLRIVGGVEAVPHSWPWTVSLQYYGRHMCGGSLINERWVITAAHCRLTYETNETSMYSIVVGLHTQGENNPLYTQRIFVEKIISNHKYIPDSNAQGNDIMLIKLADPVSFNDGVLPVCLPETAFSTMESGTRCWTIGWGTTTAGGYGSDVLQQVTVPLIDLNICNQPDWYNGDLDDTMVCAGYEEGGKDSCQGDSGGPLVCNKDGRWILYGIVSWGHGCAGERKPGLYARTSAYIKWIKEGLKNN